MTQKVPVAVLEETLQRSIDGFDKLSDTLDRILAVVAECGDADLRQQVAAIMASRRQPTRVDFADLPVGGAVN